jgi:hypothetical protein
MSETASGIRVRDALLLCGVLLLVVVTLAARKSGAGAAPTTTAPVLQLGGADQQLGEVAAGTRLRTRLQIANAGGRRLVVNEKSCALCDDDALPTIIVGPGETRAIELTWDTAGVSGPLRQVRTFTTNDPQQTSFQARVSAEVVPPSVEDVP